MKRVAPSISIVAGLYWIIGAFKYGLWVESGPGGGLFPLIGGALITVFGVLSLLRQLKEKDYGVSFNKNALIPILGVLCILILSYIIGLLLAIAVLQFIWMYYREKSGIKSAMAVCICCTVVIYLVFDYWLKVPLPMGLFEKLSYY